MSSDVVLQGSVIFRNRWALGAVDGLGDEQEERKKFHSHLGVSLPVL